MFKATLKKSHLLAVARQIRDWILLTISPDFRRFEQARRLEYREFKRCHADALACRLNTDAGKKKIALVVSSRVVEAVKTEVGLMKALELAGFTPVVLTPRDRWLVKYYELAHVADILFWDDFVPHADTAKGAAVDPGIHSLDDLLTFEYEGARVGRFAASSALRRLRVGSLDLESREGRASLRPFITRAMVSATAANTLVQTVRPQLALFVDRGYTPEGELFDVCLANGIPTVTWNAAHRNNAIILKRYNLENRDEHPASLSEESWRRIRQMKWTDGHCERVRRELYSCYACGDWYSEVGTQFNRQIFPAAELRRRFGLDPARKTAVIFPHILWDGTFFYGSDLFGSYEEWFIQTVRAACANDQVNWLIKIHPGNVVKSARDGVKGEPAEVRVIRERIGRLPDHVMVIPAESDVSTFSLFGPMDFCVTVRGTVGIEAATFGIPVLTAGTGRYDRRGFTIDSDSCEEYLLRIARIQDIPPLAPEQTELAQRFAYAVFVLRPLQLTTVTLEYQKDARATPRSRINALTREDWLSAPDLMALAEWFMDGKRYDFLAPDIVA